MRCLYDVSIIYYKPNIGSNEVFNVGVKIDCCYKEYSKEIINKLKIAQKEHLYLIAFFLGSKAVIEFTNKITADEEPSKISDHLGVEKIKYRTDIHVDTLLEHIYENYIGYKFKDFQ